MKRRKLYIIILVVSVLGLFAVQYQYLNIGLNLAKVQFQRKIGTAAKQIKEDLSTENQLTFLLGKAISLDDAYFTLSMDSVQDASRHFLNDFITHRLTENGIKKDFYYRLYTQDTTDYLTSPSIAEKEGDVITYPIELQGYLPLLMKKNLVLELQFEDLNNYFLFQLNGLIIPSLIFMAAIIFVVIWVLRSFYWQRNIITTTNDFINNLTHELKTPVFSVGLAAKILQEKASEDQQPVIQHIQQQTERMKGHIDKVLELGHLESKRKVMELQPIDFAPSLHAICKDFQQVLLMESGTFDYKIAADTIPILAAQGHLENAIYNILDNAKKYAEDPKISLNASIIDQKLVIEIRDNGMGMTQKEQERIFEKYYRVTKDNTHRVKGYGLGLSYVKEIVKRHKGKISVESELGHGTTFTIKIPIHGGQ